MSTNSISPQHAEENLAAEHGREMWYDLERPAKSIKMPDQLAHYVDLSYDEYSQAF
jgi:hypothetical protein